MISRNRSAPTAAAISIECTTSANSTVTCLNSAGSRAGATDVPHSLQNLAVAFNCVPHDLHASAAVVMRRPDSLVNSPAASELQHRTRRRRLPRQVAERRSRQYRVIPRLNGYENAEATLRVTDNGADVGCA
jgi:hypothetical protein